MLLEVFFHFFGGWLSDDTYPIIMDFNFLMTLTVFVIGCGFHNYLDKLV